MLDPGNALGADQERTDARSRRDVAQAQPSHAGYPAISETLPGYDFPTWTAMVGPPGMSRERREQDPRRDGQRTEAEGRRGQVRRSGTLPFYIKPEELKALIDAETAKWIKIAKEDNIQAE